MAIVISIKHVLAQKLKENNIQLPDNDVLIRKLLVSLGYIDDDNKGSNIRTVILEHELNKVIGTKYNKLYQPSKSNIVLSHGKKTLDNEVQEYIENNIELKVIDNDEYEVLRVPQREDKYNDFMIDKLNQMQEPLKLAQKIKNKHEKYRLLNSVFNIDGLIYYIQNCPNAPSIDENGEIIIGEHQTWIEKLENTCKLIIDICTNLNWTKDAYTILGFARRNGGLSLCNINNTLAPHALTSIHRVIKKVWSLLDEQIICVASNKVKNSVIKMMDLYNNNVQTKDRISIQDLTFMTLCLCVF